jgi:hydroxyacylglutathione hydrolase
MPIQIHQFPCLTDNYGYLVRDEASGLAAAIDTPDADAVIKALRETGWPLALIMNTHWHPDHAGGNTAVKAATGARIVGPEEVTRIAPLDQPLMEGDEVALGDTRFRVIDTGGHTLGHISYYDAADQVVFVGDTMFAMGCGRVFEGTPEQMWGSLQKLSALPDATRVYCAHEYTAANARFALSVDDDPAVKARADQVFAARARGEPTVPTTIGAEKATSPFLRAPLLAKGLGQEAALPAEAFAAVRAAKDAFAG